MYKNIFNVFFILLILMVLPANLSSSNINSLKSEDNFLDSNVNLANVEQNEKLNANNAINIQDSDSEKSLQIEDLLRYLRFIYDDSTSSFSDSNSRKQNTTVTTARGLAVLKMTGLYGYVIPSGDSAKIFSGFGSISDKGGFKIHSSVEEESVVGTYGVILSSELLNLKLNKIGSQAEEFILSNFKVLDDQGGFNEKSESGISVKTTYYAIHTLSILNYNFNSSMVNKITNFLKSTWSNELNYFNSSADLDQSEILTSFQAISTLYFLNLTNSIDFNFWNTIKSGLSTYLTSRQISSGQLLGGIESATEEANVADTGLALSTLFLLNLTNILNLSGAINFILDSQLPGPTATSDKGGFSLNNLTHNVELGEDNGVRLRYTYYAILGLYSSGYLANNTKLVFETDYSQTNNVNNKNNEIIPGKESFILSQIISFGQKAYFQENDILISIDGLTVEFNKSREIGSNDGFEYTHKILNTTSNWTLGERNLEAYFSLNNFSILPNLMNKLNDTITIRLPISLSINTFYKDLEVNPGTLLEGKIEYENSSINEDLIGIDVLGNFSINLVFPNKTQIELNSSQDFQLNTSIKFYYFNYTLANNSQLGDYFVNITYTNGTGLLFYTQQQVRVDTQLVLVKIESSNPNSIEIYPNEPFKLNFTIQYENTFMSSKVPSIKANFIQNITKKKLFSVNLTQIEGKLFTSNSSETVPIDLLMGKYNVSIEINWKSETTGSLITSTFSNETLPYVEYSAIPTLSFTEDLKNKEVYSGEFINLTGNLGIKPINKDVIYYINDSANILVELQNTSNRDEIFQTLQYEYINNSIFFLTGEINPNINHKSDVNITMRAEIKYKSSGLVDILYNEDSSEFRTTFLFKKANLKLDSNSVEFLTGGRDITENSQPTMIINFRILSEDSLYVTGLNLNATLLFSLNADTNKSEITLPSITSINKSYQLFIPLFNLAPGEYEIKIQTSLTNLNLGSIFFTVIPELADSAPSIENIYFISVIILALIVTFFAFRVKEN